MARPGFQKHPKFRRLVFLLREPVPHCLGYVECMWDVAYQNGDPYLGDATDVELAAQWPGEPGKFFQAILDCRLIDEVDGKFQVHDLFENAPEYVANRAEREYQRKIKGKTLHDLRAEAGRKGGLAKAGKRVALATEPLANASTPAPAPAPAPAPSTEQIQEPPGGGGESPSNCPPADPSNGPKPKPSKPAYTASFERWYAAYPRKVAKQDAATAFGRILPRVAASRRCPTEEALEWLISVTQQFARSAAGRSGEFCPYPATWLNSGRYDDDQFEWEAKGSSNGKPDTRYADGSGQRYRGG